MPLTLNELERRAYITNDQATLAAIEAAKNDDGVAEDEHFWAGFRAAKETALIEIGFATDLADMKKLLEDM